MPSRAPRPAALLLALGLLGCPDPGLGRLEGRATAALVEAEAIQGNRAAFEAEDAQTRTRLAELGGWFDASARPETLLAALQELQVPDGRADPVGEPRVLLPSDLGPEPALALAQRLLRAGRPVLLSSIRCDQEGCTAALSPPGRLRGSGAAAPPSLADLPPRPWWPPEAGRWDRVRDQLARLEAARTSLGALAGLKERHAELQALFEASEAAWRWSELVAGAAADAIAADAATLDVTAFQHADGRSVRVVAPGARATLVEALGRRGRVTASGPAWVVTVEHLAATLARRREGR